MTFVEAVEFLMPAVDGRGLTWADLGAGSGTFTEALAHLLGPDGTVIAVDNDPRAVRRLRQLADRSQPGAASIEVVKGDLNALSAIPERDRGPWHGALLANVLHYFQEPGRVLEDVVSRLSHEGRAVVIEYRRATASPWVPYPISPEHLQHTARASGFGSTRIVSERPSRFRGSLYCAVLEPAENHGPRGERF